MALLWFYFENLEAYQSLDKYIYEHLLNHPSNMISTKHININLALIKETRLSNSHWKYVIHQPSSTVEP